MKSNAYKELQDGIHYLSGVGTFSEETYDEIVEANTFCIDGTVFVAYLNPSDGYRSYGSIYPEPEAKCQYMFSPQPVRIEFVRESESDDMEPYPDNAPNREYYRITDAVNGKEILVVGNSYWDEYYPMAIFNYTPENLEINQGK